MSIQNVSIQGPKIWMPTKLEAAVSIKKQFTQKAAYVAGATLLQLKWQAGQEIPQHHISLEKIVELQQMKMDQHCLEIGACTKLSSLRSDSLIKNRCAIISEAIRTIAAPAVRNRGTVGGNIMWGEGDLIPLFLAMKANLTFFIEDNFQTISISDWLHNPHYKDELLVKVEIPLSKQMKSYTFYKKIGRRETFTAAIVTVAGQIGLSDTNELQDVLLAIGGGSNKPIRLGKVEQYLLGKKMDQIHWSTVYQYILDEFQPVNDPFVTSSYKKKVAANLIILELQSFLVKSN